jgi:hypothetical protein
MMGTSIVCLWSIFSGRPLNVILSSSSLLLGKPSRLHAMAHSPSRAFYTVSIRGPARPSTAPGMPLSASDRTKARRHVSGSDCGLGRFAAFLALLLGLLAFAGTAAVTAVFALAVVGQYTAYTIPIAARFLFDNDFKPGAFHLGRFVRPLSLFPSMSHVC